jgi:hypothetical protein
VKPRVQRSLIAVGRALRESGYPRGMRYLAIVVDDTQDPPVMDLLHCTPNEIGTLREEAIDLLETALDHVRKARAKSESLS